MSDIDKSSMNSQKPRRVKLTIYTGSPINVKVKAVVNIESQFTYDFSRLDVY